MNNPVVGIGIIVWNGAATIAQVLESLLNQSYKNIKIYILDNQSFDGTDTIIKSYATKDSRIEFYIDETPNNIVLAQKKVFDKYLTKHEFCMFCCDDDLYEHKYIECVMQELLINNLDLVYTHFKNIDEKNETFMGKNYPYYKKNNSFLKNAGTFLFYRNCIPIFFGIYKTSSLKKSISYFKTVDNYGFNHENLMIFHFLLRNKVNYIKTVNFYYRMKERILLYEKRGYLFSTYGIKKYIYSIIHNINISIEFAKIIANSKLNWSQLVILFTILPIAFVYKTFYVFLIFPLINNIKKYYK